MPAQGNDSPTMVRGSSSSFILRFAMRRRFLTGTCCKELDRWTGHAMKFFWTTRNRPRAANKRL
jgi:hypothetical protein